MGKPLNYPTNIGVVPVGVNRIGMGHSMTITPSQLAEWKALADAATEGPWRFLRHGGVGDVRSPTASGFENPVATDMGRRNAAFTAAARTAVPALVAEVERLQALLSAQAAREAEIIERCAKVADAEASAMGALSTKANTAGDAALMYRANTAFHAAYRIASSIRSLSSPPVK